MCTRNRYFADSEPGVRPGNEPDPLAAGTPVNTPIGSVPPGYPSRRASAPLRVRLRCPWYDLPGIESRNQGGREHATQPDPDQNLACRPFAAAQGLGGHAGAASGRRNHRPCGDRRQGHAGHRRDGQETDRGRHRLHRRRRILDGAQSRPLRRPLHRCRGALDGAGRAADDPALDPRARRISGFLWRLRPGWVVVSGPRRNADATDD